MVSISSIEKDSIVITRDFFKDYMLVCNIGNQMHAKFQEKYFHQAVSARFAQKSFFCKRYEQNVLHYEWQKSLKSFNACH